MNLGVDLIYPKRDSKIKLIVKFLFFINFYKFLQLIVNLARVKLYQLILSSRDKNGVIPPLKVVTKVTSNDPLDLSHSPLEPLTSGCRSGLVIFDKRLLQRKACGVFILYIGTRFGKIIVKLPKLLMNNDDGEH